MTKFWPFILNVLLFAAVASGVPFIVLYYQSVGFTGTQIGVLTGITPLITLFSIPFWTSLADATGRHRTIMGIAIIAGAITISALGLFNTFAPILVDAILFSAFFGSIFSFADNATMLMLADQREMYGRIRLGGTIGYGLAAAIAGVFVENYGLKVAFLGSAVLLLAALMASQKLIYPRSKSGGSTKGNIRLLLANRRWLIFLMIAWAGGVGTTATNNYFFPYLREVGATESTMGLMLTIGTLAEIPILFFGNRLIRRFRPFSLLILATAITGVRLLLFAASGTVGLVILLQLLNGMTFPAMWIAGVAYADKTAPPGMGAMAQGYFGAMVFGFGPAVGGFIGGPLLANLGGHGLYLIFGVIVFGILAIAALAQRFFPWQAQDATGAAQPDGQA